MCLCFNYDDFQSITARTSRFCEFPGVRRAESSVGRDGDSTGFSMDSTWAANMGKFTNQHGGCGILHVIGDLELFFYFSIYWEYHHPNWRIFFRGVVLPPTSHVWCLLVYSWCATIDRVGMRFFLSFRLLMSSFQKLGERKQSSKWEVQGFSIWCTLNIPSGKLT